jgi:hypothetical protein
MIAMSYLNCSWQPPLVPCWKLKNGSKLWSSSHPCYNLKSIKKGSVLTWLIKSGGCLITNNIISLEDCVLEFEVAILFSPA